TAYGPTKPPSVPMLLMNARPPAAARPVRNRVGIVQKIARAAVMPINASVIHERETQRFDERIANRSPIVATKHAIRRLPIFFPVRSTQTAQRIIATDAAT